MHTVTRPPDKTAPPTLPPPNWPRIDAVAAQLGLRPA